MSTDIRKYLDILTESMLIKIVENSQNADVLHHKLQQLVNKVLNHKQSIDDDYSSAIKWIRELRQLLPAETKHDATRKDMNNMIVVLSRQLKLRRGMQDAIIWEALEKWVKGLEQKLGHNEVGVGEVGAALNTVPAGHHPAVPNRLGLPTLERASSAEEQLEIINQYLDHPMVDQNTKNMLARFKPMVQNSINK